MHKNKRLFIVGFALFFSFSFGLYLGAKNNFFLMDVKQKTEIIIKNFIKSFNENNYEVKSLFINIDSLDYNKLIEEQKKHSKRKWLDKELTKYYKCKIKVDSLKLKGKLRTKGLLLQNYEFKKGYFSYKIKLKKDTLNNLRKFYLNYPKKRNNLHEWYGEKLLKYHGLINQKNLFYNVYINHIDKGLYLFEESFDINLLKHNQRPLGPIIYFSKEKLIKYGTNNYGETFFMADLLSQYPNEYNPRAKELLIGFIEKKYKPKEVFDINKLTSHFALVDLIGYYHQLNYHNIKFYYNPKTDKIELIANDFQFYNIKKWTKEIFGIVFNKQNYESNYLDYLDSPWMRILFNDYDFLNDYLIKLDSISNVNNINSFFKSIEESEDSAKKIIISNFDPLYYPKVKSIIHNNANHIRSILSKEYDLKLNKLPKSSDECIVLGVKNYNYLPVRILGLYCEDNMIYSCKEDNIILGKNYGEPIQLKKIQLLKQKKISCNIPIKLKYFVFGDNKIRSVNYN